jgi:hypothetical protein
MLSECGVDACVRTRDGTTPLMWASWESHLPVMDILYEQCPESIHEVNSYKCTPVLWAAQGSKTTVETLEWFYKRDKDTVWAVNQNGHGVLHKACQRGNAHVCEWFVTNVIMPAWQQSRVWLLVGPDTEGHLPSDLAGMEGHDDLAEWISEKEMKLVEKLVESQMMQGRDDMKFPDWLERRPAVYSTESLWESGGGIRRLQTVYHQKSCSKVTPVITRMCDTDLD